MEHYVTLFDRLFLPQGLALHMSMERYVKDYTLWILCVDDEAHTVLAKLELPNVRLLKLSKLETEELLRVKTSRSNGEYCWTLTPFAPRFVFEESSDVERVTYVDADLWFRKHPKSIFEEFDASGKHVLITEHSYAREYEQSTTSGRFCVQFITFTRDGGETVRKYWEDQCIEWCYARFEDGKFGDQKYLDDWPDRFGTLVHVLREKKAALAPWNASRFSYSNAVFYHFHGLRIKSPEKIYFGPYILPRLVIKNVYNPFVADLRLACQMLKNIGYLVTPQSSGSQIVKKLKIIVRLTLYSLSYVMGLAKLRSPTS